MYLRTLVPADGWQKNAGLVHARAHVYTMMCTCKHHDDQSNELVNIESLATCMRRPHLYVYRYNNSRRRYRWQWQYQLGSQLLILLLYLPKCHINVITDSCSNLRLLSIITSPSLIRCTGPGSTMSRLLCICNDVIVSVRSQPAFICRLHRYFLRMYRCRSNKITDAGCFPEHSVGPKQW